MELERVVQQGCYTIHLGPIRGFDPGEGNYQLQAIGFDVKNQGYTPSVININVRNIGYEFTIHPTYSCSNSPVQ